MKSNIISISDAQKILINSQLLGKRISGNTKNDLYKIIEHLGYIQIDTISIVERAHKHVLWSRMPAFKNEMLDELIDKDKKVFEFWDHAASYMSIKNYRFTLPRKLMYAKKYADWEKKNIKLLKFIMNRITSEGALQSRDFEDSKKRGLWWDWKPLKEGLEFLLHSGRLALKARKGFQKVYDLPERVLPKNFINTIPTNEELSEHIIMKSLTAAGISSEKELTYLRHHNKAVTKLTLNRLLDENKISKLTIHGVNETYYYSVKNLALLHSDIPQEVRILSPFDNLVIQRKRLNKLFEFDYKVECYVTQPKRKYGYFCLPVLYGNKFAGRIDAKADRANNTFNIINEYWETGHKYTNKFKTEYKKSLFDLAVFSGCKKIKFLV
ncbi:MAG: YcaQ family DNA glycosylase [Ignavibacteria bacterium]|nr:YcaQ family DNA glycosylase [Ignavibacteria bacterium]